MTRVIQDSDDEGDLLSPVASLSGNSIPDPSENRSTGAPLDPELDPATYVFIEPLRREIMHFEDRLQRDEHGDSGDIVRHSSKRRKLSHESRQPDISAVEVNVFDPQYVLDQENLFPQIQNQTQCDLPPTLEQNFVQTLPLPTFSEGVSTIPDNTIEIRRIAEQATFVKPLDQNLLFESTRLQSEAKSSLPWSEILKAQSQEEDDHDGRPN